MSLKEQIIKEKLPGHIAIIMDGNGRWAKQRGEHRLFGHKNGIEAVKRVVEASKNINLKYLTLYAFSTENWNRPEYEVTGLMNLLVIYLNSELNTLIKNDVKINVIGDRDALPKKVNKEIDKAIEKTKNNKSLNLILALSYSSRWEIIQAIKNIAADVKTNQLDPNSINDETFAGYLATQKFPDPELLIRTSGEYRISNFLLWQIAYTELYFTEILWPDFNEDELYKAIIDYQKRERRFGKISEQIVK